MLLIYGDTGCLRHENQPCVTVSTRLRMRLYVRLRIAMQHPSTIRLVRRPSRRAFDWHRRTSGDQMSSPVEHLSIIAAWKGCQRSSHSPLSILTILQNQKPEFSGTIGLTS